ncbi:MAG: hypothetical protein RL026_222 [Pseudomonadota bacterium]|jgi:tRNA threonylcarbamoyladenosine biosynthesis protein TsaB
MKLLAVDTASGCCSAALWMDGGLLTREFHTGRDHARLLLPMIHSLLAEAGWPLGRLDAIAFGRGPGSFTGLRIAAAVTQGLAFGADLPVLPVSDLEALALQVARHLQAVGAAAPGQVLACMDARMGEIYSGLFLLDHEGLPVPAVERVEPAAACVARLSETSSVASPASLWAGAGMGWQAYAEVLGVLRVPMERVLPQAEPLAVDIARLGARHWSAGGALPAEAAVPVYLRDDVARPAASPAGAAV